MVAIAIVAAAGWLALYLGCAAVTSADSNTVTYWCLALDDGQRGWTFDVGKAAFGQFPLGRAPRRAQRDHLIAAAYVLVVAATT